MKSSPTQTAKEEPDSRAAAHQIAGAHHLLTQMRKRIESVEKNPELQEAIRKLEVALNILTIKTGALL